MRQMSFKRKSKCYKLDIGITTGFVRTTLKTMSIPL